jgi:hypothetical protein
MSTSGRDVAAAWRADEQGRTVPNVTGDAGETDDIDITLVTTGHENLLDLPTYHDSTE